MFESIKKQILTVEGIINMSNQDLYYAWKWYEEGCFELTSECESELANQMCLRGL
jgi:predicted transport protein